MLILRRLYHEVGGREQAQQLPVREYQEIYLSIVKEISLEVGQRTAARKKAEEDARRAPPKR